jgi:carbon-monoxide dehydrogenase medium subunit
MIPSAFDYTRPSTMEDALAALRQAGEDAKVLAGGQSLIPVLRLRLAAPTVLVDLGDVESLRGVREDGDHLVIGAMTTHDELTRDQLVREHVPLLAQAAQVIGDRQVRHLGTLGGSLAHADPAGDLPAVALALDAVLSVEGPSGSRSVPASEFFTDYLTTALGPDEILAEIRIPKLTGWGCHYEKFSRVAQAWAIVGVAAAVRRENGDVAEARVALTSMAPVPLRARAVEEALVAGGSLADAAARAADDTRPSDDITASAEYRAHLVRVLTGRALAAC